MIKFLTKLVLFLTVTSFANITVTSYEASSASNKSTPVIALENNTDDTLNGFVIYYYFSSAKPADVRIDDYYVLGGVTFTYCVRLVDGDYGGIPKLILIMLFYV